MLSRSGPGSDSRRLTSTVWPDSSDKLLEVELAQLILRSELLVTEDEEFINNYILTQDTMEEYKTEVEGGRGSVMKDVLLLSPHALPSFQLCR